MPAPIRLTNPPRSGDPLTDWFFGQLVHALKGEHVIINRKRHLADPDDRSRTAVRGLMDPFVHPAGGFIHILINPARDANRTRDDEVETLMHELAHVIMPGVSERGILRLERVLVGNLTAHQRRYLKGFLPRHTIKHYPAMPAAHMALAAQKKKKKGMR